MRVFLLGDRPTENNIEFYNLLGKQCDLTVAFQQYPKESKVWEFSSRGNSFKGIFPPGINLGGAMNISFGIGRMISESTYDVYVVGGMHTATEKSAIRELAINNKKFVFASHGAFPAAGENNIAKRKKQGYLHSASYYLSPGSVCDAYLSSYGVDMSKVYRYSYAAFGEKDFKQVTPLTTARARGLKSRYRLKDNVFISTVDFTAEQGIDILLDIWKLAGLENSSLLIISDAESQKQLHKMARHAALNDVVMLDYQPKELVRELIRISKAMIYPARFDAWGLPVVEGLSCGVPVISSYNVGAAHDLILNDKTGYVENISEPIGWGERMRDIISRDILWEKMRNNAYSSMKLFTMESRVKTYIDVFKKCAIIQR